MNNYLDFEQEWLNKHPDRKSTLNKMRKALDVKEITWSMLTKVNLVKVADYFKECVTGNSCRTYFAELNSFLHCYEDEGIIPCKHPEEVLKAKKLPQQSIYLTEDEIKRIEDYYNNLLKVKGHKPEKDVLTLFLLESFTGARISDCVKFTANNLNDGRLTYTSVKTSVLTEVPIHRLVPNLIGRIPRVNYSETTVNRTLKRVARKVGITEPVTIFTKGKQQTRPKYEFMSSHVGRKSFATNLARRGVDIYTISAFCGHKSTLQTDHYIVRDTVNTPKEALSFFNG